MKTGFVARWDPQDKRTWSGIGYYTRREIARYSDVEDFFFPLPRWLREWLTTQKSINRRWFGKHTAVEFLTSYARYFSNELDKALQKRPVDLLFVLASPQLIAFSKTKLPVILMADATFRQIQGYYPYFSNLANYNIKCGIDLDSLAFKRASHCLLASNWCRQSAITDYGIPPEKLSVALLGANLDLPVADTDPVSAAQDTCRLVFLGVEWERKGGETALATYQLLKERGLPVSLTIMGCTPPSPVPAEVTVIPFLNKNIEAERLQHASVLKQASFLLLPSRAECAGVVFSEAAAYGIPSVTTDTGGISDYVEDGVTGFVLPLSAGAAEFAGRIAAAWTDKNWYAQLRRQSRERYERLLNWENWGNSFHRLSSSLIRTN